MGGLCCRRNPCIYHHPQAEAEEFAAEVETLRRERDEALAEAEKLRGAAAYQAEAHTLRTAMKMLAEKLRSWGWQNRKNEANFMMVSRALDSLRAENERLREALKPFAAAADWDWSITIWKDEPRQNAQVLWHNAKQEGITLADFDTASALLAKKETDHGDW
jgi:hypothetical protein